MADVKGGRQDYPCGGCEEVIAKGTPHVRMGNSPNFKRYHEGCVPAKKSPKEPSAEKK